MRFEWLCLHKNLVWGVNPKNYNSEPKCLKCGKFIPKTMFMQIGRFLVSFHMSKEIPLACNVCGNAKFEDTAPKWVRRSYTRCTCREFALLS